MNKSAILILFILFLSNISAQCNDTQININSAPIEELDNLTGVGMVIAQNIINSRPFSSVDDLIKVNRIGNKTLEKIKAQGLACVSDNNSIDIQNLSNLTLTNESNNISIQTGISSNQISVIKTLKPVISDMIILNNSKDIKSNENLWSSDKLAIYGFIVFSILIAILLLIKNRNNRKELA